MPNAENIISSSTVEPAFFLEYSFVGQRLLGENLRKFSSVLRLTSEDRMAFLEKHRVPM